MNAKIDPENPPIDFVHGRLVNGRGPEARENARKAFATVRGRPRKGAKAEGSRARTLRLPDATWRDLEALAKARKMTVHRLLRVFVAERLYTTSWAEHLAESKAHKPKARNKPSKASDAA